MKKQASYVVSACGSKIRKYTEKAIIAVTICLICFSLPLCSFASETAAAQVNTEIPIETIRFDKKKLTMEIGQSLLLKPEILPTNHTKQRLSWSSNKRNIVSVSKSGKLTAKKAGTALITVTAPNGKKASCKITVSKPLKILIIGNSDVYYNDLGGYLSALGHKQKHRMIVVHAVHGGWGPRDLMQGRISSYYWDAAGKNVIAHNNENGVRNYNTTLRKVLYKDWGGLKRSGKWDYIIFLNDANQEGGMPYLADGDHKMFSYVRRTLPHSKNFVVVGYHYNNSTGAGNNREHRKAALKDHFTFVITGEYFRKVNSIWADYFTIRDKYWHPSARAQYFNACAIYSVIFGKQDLAKNMKASKFIKLYNKSGGVSTQFYRPIYYQKSYFRNQAQNIDKKSAKKIQSVIYKNYEHMVFAK